MRDTLARVQLGQTCVNLGKEHQPLNSVVATSRLAADLATLPGYGPECSERTWPDYTPLKPRFEVDVRPTTLPLSRERLAWKKPYTCAVLPLAGCSGLLGV